MPARGAVTPLILYSRCYLTCPVPVFPRLPDAGVPGAAWLGATLVAGPHVAPPETSHGVWPALVAPRVLDAPPAPALPWSLVPAPPPPPPPPPAPPPPPPAPCAKAPELTASEAASAIALKVEVFRMINLPGLIHAKKLDH